MEVLIKISSHVWLALQYSTWESSRTILWLSSHRVQAHGFNGLKHRCVSVWSAGDVGRWIQSNLELFQALYSPSIFGRGTLLVPGRVVISPMKWTIRLSCSTLSPVCACVIQGVGVIASQILRP